MIALDLDTIEAFLSLIGDKRLRMDRDGKVHLVPPPAVRHAFADELIATMQPFLRHCYFGAAVRPGVPATWPWACPGCRSWSMQTVQRSKTRCYCGTKQKRQLIVIPWSTTNHHGRPRNPHYRHHRLKENTK